MILPNQKLHNAWDIVVAVFAARGFITWIFDIMEYIKDKKSENKT